MAKQTKRKNRIFFPFPIGLKLSLFLMSLTAKPVWSIASLIPLRRSFPIHTQTHSLHRRGSTSDWAVATAWKLSSYPFIASPDDVRINANSPFVFQLPTCSSLLFSRPQTDCDVDVRVRSGLYFASAASSSQLWSWILDWGQVRLISPLAATAVNWRDRVAVVLPPAYSVQSSILDLDRLVSSFSFWLGPTNQCCQIAG